MIRQKIHLVIKFGPSLFITNDEAYITLLYKQKGSITLSYASFKIFERVHQSN